MMKLRFRIGAVVTFGLTCQSNLETTGKVIFANEDEVVYLPQSEVANYDYNEDRGCSGEDLDIHHTVARCQPIHLDRKLIATWTYYQVVRNKRATHYGIIKQSELANIEQEYIAEYGPDGVCLGNGEFIDK